MEGRSGLEAGVSEVLPGLVEFEAGLENLDVGRSLLFGCAHDLNRPLDVVGSCRKRTNFRLGSSQRHEKGGVSVLSALTELLGKCHRTFTIS